VAAIPAQTVLLNVDRKAEDRISQHGPNMKKFAHFLIRAGAIVSGDKAGARIEYGTSVNLAFGVRKKFKISPFYSIGYDIENEYTDYKIKQEKGKLLPDTVINNVSGRLDYSSIGLGFYNRFNFDTRRGNFLGTFLDLGIMGEWHYSIKAIAKNENKDGTLNKNITKRLPYVNNINAKAYARFGYSHLSIYASNRITDLFKSSYDFPDLPRIIAGIELAVF
jgi:hypothetical protein